MNDHSETASATQLLMSLRNNPVAKISPRNFFKTLLLMGLAEECLVESTRHSGAYNNVYVLKGFWGLNKLPPREVTESQCTRPVFFKNRFIHLLSAVDKYRVTHGIKEVV